VGEDARYQAFWQIMAAAQQGSISPEGALRWARRAANGEPVDVLASLAGPDQETRLAWMKAAARPDITVEVLEALWVRGAAEMGDEEADRLLPPRGSALVPGPGEMSNEEADELLPPRTVEEADRRARAAYVRAAAVEDLTDEQLYDLLFGGGE